MDDVDGTRLQAFDHSLPVVLGAKRWRELEEGAVGRDVVLVEREVVDRHAGGDAAAAAPGGGDEFDGSARRDLRGVVPDAGEGGELQVAGERDRLGLDRNALESGDGRQRPLVHHAFADEAVVGDMVDDRQVEIGRVGESRAEQAGGLD